MKNLIYISKMFYKLQIGHVLRKQNIQIIKIKNKTVDITTNITEIKKDMEID